jgi:hypothetical protein
LEGLDLPDDFPLDAVVGQESIIQVPAHGIWQGTDIHGKILWLRPGEGGLKTFQAALELQETDPQARRMLENQLITYPKDMKELWDHWDQVHTAAPGHSKGDQSVYFVGMGAVAAGLMLHYSGPESINPLGIIIAIYGSLVMAGKSLWSMWGRRTVGSRQ